MVLSPKEAIRRLRSKEDYWLEIARDKANQHSHLSLTSASELAQHAYMRGRLDERAKAKESP